jgi:hypothetical protein
VLDVAKANLQMLAAVAGTDQLPPNPASTSGLSRVVLADRVGSVRGLWIDKLLVICVSHRKSYPAKTSRFADTVQTRPSFLAPNPTKRPDHASCLADIAQHL